MAVSTSGNYWHDSNRGLSLYITVYLSLFALILLLSVSTTVHIMHKKKHQRERERESQWDEWIPTIVGLKKSVFFFFFPADRRIVALYLRRT